MTSMCSTYSSRIFTKTLNRNLISPVAFSLSKKLSSSSYLLQVRAMANSSAVSSPFTKVQIQRGDTTFDAYVVGKDDAPGIVVLQEWYGVVFEIKNHAQKISQFDNSYKALTPDLYREKVGLDVAEAQHLIEGLDWQGAVKDIEASVNWLTSNGSKKFILILTYHTTRVNDKLYV